MNLFSLSFCLLFLYSSLIYSKTCDRRNAHLFSAQSCLSCHSGQHQDWSKSRHSVSYTNPIFQKGYYQEPDQRCLACHTPVTKLNSEGVTCLACHNQDSGSETFIKESFFCAKCHQFKFRGSEIHAQKTYNEWLEYKKLGGTKTCQNCHMPNGSHLFLGPHSYTAAPTSLEIKLTTKGKERILTMSNLKAGHDIPTGDVYRHLTIEIKKTHEKEFQILTMIGHNPFWKTLNKKSELVYKNNNAIKPNESRSIAISKDTEAIQVIYHFEASWAGDGYYKNSDLKKKIIFSWNSH